LGRTGDVKNPGHEAVGPVLPNRLAGTPHGHGGSPPSLLATVQWLGSGPQNTGAALPGQARSEYGIPLCGFSRIHEPWLAAARWSWSESFA
jgi:hypothetical protein